ncbi:MAG TPA: transglutaminase-like domain-containing protein [Spirochaetota bacterium]|nr:transglutaminase-like domain-containing protein [Spirochaetota bacterium]HPJ43894.1 transglutaminase-like domain-containing protein [Spirochaetota bacterium]HPR39007.1 transglutaminase-like domain-containing protein [Spirochaetota bacterium]
MLNADSIEDCLKPGSIINSDNPVVIEYASEILGGEDLSAREKAVKLYLRVRDDIKYNPYLPFYKAEHYLASNIIKSGTGFCIPKAALLCAVARASGIPARIGFASVRNHLSTKQFLAYLGTDVIAYHGFSELWIDGKWVKATPAFNAELCLLHKVPPLEFDGSNDSIFHEFNGEQKKFMEYTAFHGVYHDVPVDMIVEEWKRIYGCERVETWIRLVEHNDGELDFTKEDAI